MLLLIRSLSSFRQIASDVAAGGDASPRGGMPACRVELLADAYFAARVCG